MMKIYLSYIVFNCAIPGFRCMIPSDTTDEQPSEIADDSVEEIFDDISTLHALVSTLEQISACLWYLWVSYISSVN